jgi:16S rRNA processing protein RimM
MAAQWLEVGRIGTPFGVKGWVRVESFTDPPERLFTHKSWELRGAQDAPQSKRLLEGREHGDGFIARLDGIEDRDAAALIRGSVISVARSALPALKPREYYQSDLVGLAVRNLAGIELGTVRHFAQTPGGAVMVVLQQDGRELWVPATPQHLSRVELDEGRVLINWPAETA